MSSRCEYIFNYFGDRFILLKDDWVKAVIDFIQEKTPQSRQLSDEKFAALVFDQWACSNISSTSFPIFDNHGIDQNSPKQFLKSAIVCQINSFIDVGSPFYAQFCSLKGGKKEDNSGFEKVFHEKEDDFDSKPSRLLKLTLTDGEASLKAIEFWKCPDLSLHCKPGTKILIYPPCVIRKGTFLLKPRNFQVLGGGVLPALSSHRPVVQYAKMLGIKNFKVANQPEEEEVVQPQRNISTENRRTSGNTVTNENSFRPSGPSANISRYFNKKPPPFCAPSTSSENREVSPDLFEDDIDYDDFKNDKFLESTPARRSFENSIHVSSLIRQVQDENEDFDEPIKRRFKSPKKRISAPETTAPSCTPRTSGMLTSRKIDPMDEVLENMIEEDEEPVKCPEEVNKKRSLNPFIKTPAAKRIKVEEESDDEIQIIEMVAVKKTEETMKEELKTEDEGKENEELTSEERAAIEAFSKLKLTSLAENTKKMKYSVGSKRFLLLAVIDDIAEPLRVVDEMWTMKVRLIDDSQEKTDVFIDNQTLERLIGYTCQEAITIRKSANLEKRKDGKRRLEALEQQLHRLDLVFEIEFFPGATSSCPVIRSIKTLTEQLDIY